jgi:alpha-tubulin suppressor-like RCC1 family protein
LALEPSGRRIKALSGNLAAGCAIFEDGEARPWGQGACPALGAVHGHITQMTQGVSHLCVRTDSGEVWCTGRGDYGMLGDGRSTDSNAYVRARGIHDATGLVAGLRYTCAIANGGDVYCWGGREDDAEGTKPRRFLPVRVAGITGARAIAGSQMHVCVLVTDGSVSCWGELPEGVSVKPQRRPEFQGALALNNGCALFQDGAVKCWSFEDNTAQSIDFTTTVETLNAAKAAECAARGCINFP